MTVWTTPTKAAATGRWPLGREAIRVRCERFVTAVARGRRPPPDAIECVRVGTHYRIEESALDAWVRRQRGNNN